MKLLATADWQCKTENLHRCELMLKQLLSTAKREKADVVLHLGDVKDAFNPVDQRVQNFMVRATKKICKVAPFHVLLGNHDRTSVNDQSESCMPVLRAAGAVTYEVPTLVCLNDVWVYMVPYLRDRKLLVEQLASVGTYLGQLDPNVRPQQGEMLLAFHTEISGCRINSHFHTFDSQNGIPPEGLWPEDYALCLGGHIHYQQKIGPDIWYVGSPFQQDWGEANNPCGFLLVELIDGQPPIIERIPSRVPGYWDPELKGFDVNKAVAQSQIRIQVPCPSDCSDPGLLLQTARKEAEVKYPQFQVHTVPVVEGVKQLRVFDNTNAAGDEELLQKYLAQTKAKEPEAMAACILYHLRKRGLGSTGLERLRFLKVEAENVLCFEKCEVHLAGKGITLVTGENQDWGGEQEARSNGSGKTSLLSLPLIALFGRTPKGQSADAWSRQGCDKPSVIKLSLLLPDGRRVEIIRRRPSGLELHVESKSGHSTLVGSGDVRATQRTIEQLLRVTWDVATNALYIGQREVGTILTGTDKERKELFSRFLGLDRFLTVQEDLREAWRKTKATLQQMRNDEAGITGQVVRARQILEAFTSTLSTNTCTNQLTEIKKQSSLLAQRFKQGSKLLEKIDAELSQQEKLYRTTDREAVTATAVYRGADKNVQSLRALVKKKVCPTCGSKLGASHMQQLLKSANEVATYSQQQQQKAARAASVLEEQLQQFRKQRQKAADELVCVQRDWQILQKREASCEAQLQLVQEAAIRRAQQEMELKKLERTRKVLIQYQTQLHKHLAFLANCIDTVGRDGLPAHLCGSICPVLNASALKFSELFTRGALGVQFTFSEGELDIQVNNRHGGSGLDDQSQGEMRMIGLIAAFSLRDVLVPYNLLILDEPGEGLDAVNAKAFADGLSEVAERFGSLFVVTHNTRILSALEPARRFHVIKENQVSKLLEETN